MHEFRSISIDIVMYFIVVCWLVPSKCSKCAVSIIIIYRILCHTCGGYRRAVFIIKILLVNHRNQRTSHICTHISPGFTEVILCDTHTRKHAYRIIMTKLSTHSQL